MRTLLLTVLLVCYAQAVFDSGLKYQLVLILGKDHSSHQRNWPVLNPPQSEERLFTWLSWAAEARASSTSASSGLPSTNSKKDYKRAKKRKTHSSKAIDNNTVQTFNSTATKSQNSRMKSLNWKWTSRISLPHAPHLKQASFQRIANSKKPKNRCIHMHKYQNSQQTEKTIAHNEVLFKAQSDDYDFAVTVIDQAIEILSQV